MTSVSALLILPPLLLVFWLDPLPNLVCFGGELVSSKVKTGWRNDGQDFKASLSMLESLLETWGARQSQTKVKVILGTKSGKRTIRGVPRVVLREGSHEFVVIEVIIDL